MAWMNQEKKAIIAAELKKVVPKGWKYSLAVENHSTLVLTIASAPVDLFEACSDKYKMNMSLSHPHYSVNQYCPELCFNGGLLETFQAIIKAMNTGNHDNSDIQTDYFDVGHYIRVNVGKFGKPFVYTGRKTSPLNVRSNVITSFS